MTAPLIGDLLLSLTLIIKLKISFHRFPSFLSCKKLEIGSGPQFPRIVTLLHLALVNSNVKSCKTFCSTRKYVFHVYDCIVARPLSPFCFRTPRHLSSPLPIHASEILDIDICIISNGYWYMNQKYLISICMYGYSTLTYA